MILNIDHIVLTVQDLQKSVDFYHRIFNFPILKELSNDHLVTLRAGQQLIRLQTADRPTELKAVKPTPSSADFCLITDKTLDEVAKHLADCHVKIIEGPVTKHGAKGTMTSLYLRDPDENLVEISTYGKN